VEERGGSGDAQRHEAIDQQRPLHLAGDDQREVLRLLDDDAARVRCKWVVGDDMVCALPGSVNRRPRLSAADHRRERLDVLVRSIDSSVGLGDDVASGVDDLPTDGVVLRRQ